MPPWVLRKTTKITQTVSQVLRQTSAAANDATKNNMKTIYENWPIILPVIILIWENYVASNKKWKSNSTIQLITAILKGQKK